MKALLIKLAQIAFIIVFLAAAGIAMWDALNFAEPSEIARSRAAEGGR